MTQDSLDLVREWASDGILTVSPRQASQVLRCKPYSLNLAAQSGRLMIPFTYIGNRLRISTLGLLNFLEGGNADDAIGSKGALSH